MALVIRLSPTGKKGERKYRIVVKEKRSKRDGGFVDLLGWYEKDNTGKKKQIDMKKYQHWVDHGALPTHAVQELVK